VHVRVGRGRLGFVALPAGLIDMPPAPEVIEIAAGDVSDELRRRGIGSDERVTLMIAPEQEWIPGRRESRARVVAACLTDDDIDRLIKQAQREVEPPRE
jgi:hypothetical protein